MKLAIIIGVILTVLATVAKSQLRDKDVFGCDRDEYKKPSITKFCACMDWMYPPFDPTLCPADFNSDDVEHIPHNFLDRFCFLFVLKYIAFEKKKKKL